MRIRPSNVVAKRRFLIAVLGGAVVSYAVNYAEWFRRWIVPSWAYVWKIPALYVIAVLVFWFVVFGFLYNEDKDKSGDGALGLFFLPLMPVITFWVYAKDAVRRLREQLS